MVMVATFFISVIPMVIACTLGLIWDDVYVTMPDTYNPKKANMYNSFTLMRFAHFLPSFDKIFKVIYTECVLGCSPGRLKRPLN